MTLGFAAQGPVSPHVLELRERGALRFARTGADGIVDFGSVPAGAGCRGEGVRAMKMKLFMLK